MLVIDDTETMWSQYEKDQSSEEDRKINSDNILCNMCMCMHICIYTHVYIHMHIHINIYTYKNQTKKY